MRNKFVDLIFVLMQVNFLQIEHIPIYRLQNLRH